MGESSSRRSKKRSAKRRERRASSPSSPPSYSVEENSDGEWVNSRLNVKWPAPVHDDDVIKHRYLSFDDESDRKQSERRSRKKKSKKEKKERKKRDESTKSSSRPARSPMSPSGKDDQYISLSTPDTDNSGSRSSHIKRVRRERKRMVIQTSPQMSKRSHHSGFATDEDGKKRVDSIVFDTRSEMKRYMRSDDILPTKRKTRSKKHSAADQRENEEYNRFYLGVRSRRGVEAKLKRPGEFFLYYERPKEGEVPATVSLMIAYLASTQEVRDYCHRAYHFPIQCFDSVDGHKRFVVMQNKSDGKMFTSILSLVKHYSLYSHVDTKTGRLETFSVSH